MTTSRPQPPASEREAAAQRIIDRMDRATRNTMATQVKWTRDDLNILLAAHPTPPETTVNHEFVGSQDTTGGCAWESQFDRCGADRDAPWHRPPHPTPPPPLPPNTRLILVSDSLVDLWATRTERGERISVEWGEPRPEGWYEPVFTVHSDDVLPAATPSPDAGELHCPTCDFDWMPGALLASPESGT